MPRIFASRLDCVSTTPLGSPVLPDLYWINAASAASMAPGCSRAPLAESSSTVVTPSMLGRLRRRSSETRRAASADQKTDLSIAKNSNLSPDIFFNLVGPRRWINGDCDPTCQHDAEKGVEELRGSGQHDGNGFIAPEAGRNESRRDVRSRGQQLAVTDVLAGIALEHMRLDAVGINFGVPAQNFNQSARRLRGRRSKPFRLFDNVARRCGSFLFTARNGADPVAGRIGLFGNMIRQADVKMRFSTDK